MTDDERAGVARALMRRPEWRGKLELLAASNERLADLCGGYAAAWRGFEYWSGRSSSLAADRVQEYNRTISELEADMEFWLARLG